MCSMPESTIEPTGSLLLDVSDLKAWYGRAQVLFGLSLRVHAGEVVGLVGRNGAGKTSTLRAIMAAGISRTGSLLLDGSDVSKLSTEALARAGVAWVPDDRRIFTSLTVRQNLELARNATAGREPVPVDELCQTFPMLEELLPKHGDQLSGGQKQLIAIARGLATRPRLLLLDEPTEGLAPLVVEEIIAIVRDIPRRFGVGVVLVEENLKVASTLCTRVYALKLGHVAYQGAFDELINDRQKLDQVLALAKSSDPY
jgi:branched-chain amino acid transport system ATP-binding protein